MKRTRVPRFFPVSQRQLAQYLGISPSMLHMAESSRYISHSLSPAASTKLAELMGVHLQVQKSGKPGPSSRKRQEAFSTDAAKTIKRLGLGADHSHYKALVLARRLADMTAKEQADRQWLNTADRLLSTLPGNKESKKDRTWLELQQLLVLKRLRKNGPLEQAKLELQIKLEKARTAVTRAMIKKLEKEMK